MKCRFLFLVLALLASLLTACSSDGLNHFTLVTEGEHEIDQDLKGDLLVTGGKVFIPAGIKLDGSAHVLAGSLIIGGDIHGDISLLNGELILDPAAWVGGDLNLGGGSYHRSPFAEVAGNVNTGVSLPALPKRKTPDGWILLLHGLVNGSLLGLAAAVMMRYIPKAVQRVGTTAINHSWVSGAMGFLVGIVGVSLLVTMAYTILLIPVTLLGLAVLGGAVLYGWIGLGVAAGRWGATHMKRPVNPSYAAFSGTLALMLAIELFTSFPGIGGLIGIVISVIGLGAVTLTRFGLRLFVPAAEETLTE